MTEVIEQLFSGQCYRNTWQGPLKRRGVYFSPFTRGRHHSSWQMEHGEEACYYTGRQDSEKAIPKPGTGTTSKALDLVAEYI